MANAIHHASFTASSRERCLMPQLEAGLQHLPSV